MITTSLVRYNKATGEVLQSITVPAEDEALYLADDILKGDGAPETHYVSAGAIKPFTPSEMAEKQALRTGFIWKMPERIAVDGRSLDQAKTLKLAEVSKRCDATLQPLRASYPQGEQQSWDKQETEARAFLANASAATLLLSPLAQARGITVADLAARVVSKADSFASYSGGVIGNRQRCEDAVTTATTIAAVDAVVW